MKFSCKTSDILEAVQLVSRAISSQQSLPILGNILIHAEGKRCTLSATDLEFSIITSFEASIENEGSITVPAKAILNFSQYNSDPEVLLETSEGTHLKCVSSHAKTLISGEAANEYPSIPSIKKQTSCSLDPAALLVTLNLVTFTCAQTTLRPVLSGVYMRSEKDSLVFVGTDSYRLSEYKLKVKKGGEDISCIVPVKVLNELRVALGGGKKKKNEGEPSPKKIPLVEIVLSAQQIEITVNETRFISRLIDGKFPDYAQILPAEPATTITLPIRELLTIVRRMHYFAKEMNNNLTFSFSKKGVRVTTPQTQIGKDEASLSGEIHGKENKIALSSSYLLDFLSHLEEESVLFSLTDSMHPAVFRLSGDPAFLHLIMPLRLQEE